MATQVQNRRGTTAEHSTFTGANGELTVDTTKKTVVVHDGSTAGGRSLLREDQSNLPTSAPTTGIYNASGSLGVATGGSGRLFIDASGNVILGTTSILSGASGRVLQIGNTSDTASTLQFAATTTGNSYIQFGDGGSPESYAGYLQYTHTDNALLFGTNKQERLRITSAGLVGVGTSSPTKKFEVQEGDIQVQNLNAALNTLSNYGLTFRSLNQVGQDRGTIAEIKTYLGGGGDNDFGLQFRTQATTAGGVTTKMTLTPAGSVGIGTTSPAASLDVNGSAHLANSSYLGFGNADALIQGSSASGANFLMFRTNVAERARIDHAGRLLVGTGIESGGALLQVNGDRIRVGTAKTPASATATGTAGEICWDTSYLYVCTASNTWKRAALSTW